MCISHARHCIVGLGLSMTHLRASRKTSALLPGRSSHAKSRPPALLLSFAERPPTMAEFGLAPMEDIAWDERPSVLAADTDGKASDGFARFTGLAGASEAA